MNRFKDRIRYAPSDGHSSSFNGGEGFTPIDHQLRNPQPRPEPEQKADDDQNNNDDNVDTYKDYWQDKPAEEPEQNANPQNPGNQQQQQTQQNSQDQTVNEKFDNFIKSHKFKAGEDIDRTALSAKIQEGDVSGIEDMIQDVAQQSMGTTLRTVHKMMQQQIDSAVDKAVKASGTNMHTHMALEKLYEAIPSSANDANKPLIRQAYGQALKKYGDPDTAIAETKKFLQHFVSTVSADVGAPPKKESANGFSQPVDYSPNGGEIKDYDEIFAS